MFKIMSNQNGLFFEATTADTRTGFRHFKMKKNTSYELEEEQYFHFLYVPEGELTIGGLTHAKITVHKGEFLVIDKPRVRIEATKKARFILFSINKYYCRIDPLFNKYMSSILSGLKREKLPLNAPETLSVFYKELILVWGKRLNDPVIGNIKKKELVAVLEHLYSKKGSDIYGAWPYERLSLS